MRCVLVNVPQVLYAWRVWAAQQRWRREQASASARVYRDRLLRKGVSCILTYAAHVNDLSEDLTQHRHEPVGAIKRNVAVFPTACGLRSPVWSYVPQRSRHLHRVVRRCALRWKQRALSKPWGEMVQEQLMKKNVTPSLTTTAPGGISLSNTAGQEDEYVNMLKEMLV